MGRSTRQSHWCAYARAGAELRARSVPRVPGERTPETHGGSRNSAGVAAVFARVTPSPSLFPLSRRGTCHGFTLIEMLVAASILCIFAAMAVPNFTGFLHNTRMTTEATAFLSDFEIARSEAARRNLSVTVCPTSDGVNCIDDWTQRRVIFLGTDAIIPGDANFIRTSAPPSGKLAVVPNNVPNAGKYIRFRPTGLVETSSPSWSLCETGFAGTGRLVSISSSGRPTVQNNACL
jgi:type IV fimbrial biogenesis protein FimT